METFKPNRKILYVDDEGNLLSSFVSMMRKENVQAFTLQESSNIDAVLSEQGPFAVVLSDQRMPHVDGVEVLERVSRRNPDTVRIMVTGYADHNDTLRAINNGGIRHYVAKPWKDAELRKLIHECIVHYNLTVENLFLVDELKQRNESLRELLDGTVVQTARILSDMLTYVNPHASAQVNRIRRLGLGVLKMMPDLHPVEQWEIQRALDLFNLGLAVLPPWIQVSLNKDGLSSVDRFPLARNHHLLAAGLLKEIPRFDGVASIIRLQQKDFDGSGEPVDEGVKGNDIPIGARLLHILIDLDKNSTENFKGREVLERMANRPSKYDVNLIARMLGTSNQQRSAGQELDVTVGGLRPGMVLLSDVITQSGELLLRSQSTITETALKIIDQWHKKDPIVGKLRVRMDG